MSNFITNSSSIVIVFLNELSAALSASPGAAASDAIVTYLHLKPDSNLAHVLDSKHQDRKLDMVAEDILQNYLDPKAYNCAPVHVFLKEVLSKLILAMTIASCSKPEWINGWIVYLLEEVDPELLNVVDASVESSTIDDRNGTEKQINEEEPANVNRSPKEARPEHRRQVSRAEEAMDEAMKEAQRLTQMIAEEDARRERERQSALSSSENVSEITTQGIFTPTSSQSDMDRAEDSDSRSVRDSMAGSGVLEKPQSRPATPPVKKPFTSFDQILPDQGATALQSNPEKSRRETAPVLTLHNAKISIFDDSMPGEKAIIKVKPTIDYLIQIEPASSTFPGWMIARKFADFETLHEVLRRISAITGVGFNEAHPALPSWKQNTKASLRNELERYLMDAVRYQQLAESEGMKRFLEKDQGLQRSPTSNKGFGWPTPSAFNDMGKGMMDVLTKAPKEVAGGGKAFFGGVTSVLGGVKKPLAGSTAPARASHTPSPSVVSLSESYMGNANIGAGRSSQESTRSIPASVRQTPTRQSVDYQNAFGADNTQEMKPRPSVSRSSTLDRTEARGNISKPPTVASRDSSPVRGVQEKFQLPPPPSEISDDYGTPARSSTRSSLDSSRPFATTQNKRFTASTSADANDPVPPPMPPRPQATAPSYPSTPPAPSKPSNSGGAHATITTKAKPRSRRKKPK
ncbi:hypothetical protein H2203_007178 [Taxawa tesnikishii (nom. ined.)]|nr:hypothetical protein H2203_007178 [Dothideales sp. JES 119]